MDDRNRQFYAESLGFFDEEEHQLFPAEAAVIDMFADSWSSTRMLDIGIGTGRTTAHFASLAAQYVGVDYGAAFVGHCREVFGESETVRFSVADARELASLGLGTFDFILFSYNGIDYSDHQGRLQALRNIRECLEDDGWFLFSTHSILGASTWWSSPRVSRQRPARSVKAIIKAVLKIPRLMWINRHVDLAAARARGYAIVNDGVYDYGLRTYYVDPVEQVAQLVDAGFAVVTAFGPTGDEIDPLETRERGWISYLVRPIAE